MSTKMYKFYDTCSLLMAVDTFLQEEEYTPVISSITLKELENIKTSSNKDADVKYSARKVLHKLNENPDNYIIQLFKLDGLKIIEDSNLPITDDSKILSTAIEFKLAHPNTIFITNDLSLKAMANLFFDKDHIQSIDEELIDEYKGYVEITMTDAEMADFYSNQYENVYNLHINEDLIIKDKYNNIVDKVCYTGDGYRPISFGNFDSTQFAKVKPMKDDPY